MVFRNRSIRDHAHQCRDPLGGGSDDLREPFGRLERGKLGRQQPIGFGQFFIERNSAADEARGKRQNDEMPLDSAGIVARDGLAEADETHRLDGERGFLADFADHRLFQRFAQLDAAAGQRIEAVRGRPRPAHDQHFAVAEYRGAHGQIRPRWISARVLAPGH